MKLLKRLGISRGDWRQGDSTRGQYHGARTHSHQLPNYDIEIDVYPIFPPPPPREMLGRRNHYIEAIRRRRFGAPEGEMEDRPLFALYRIYEHIVLDNNIGMRNELEAFWWKPWPVCDIPDPKDTDEPERYAVLASIPALLVESFNQRIDMGLRREGQPIMNPEDRLALAQKPVIRETVPQWTTEVQPLELMLNIPHTIEDETQLESIHDKRTSAPFKEKNILIWHPHIHFV